MKISKLTINSFRGLKNLEFDFKEKLNIFSGKNGLGKTSVLDAILWMLCDETIVYGKQTSDNRNSHNLKDVIHVLLELENGVVLERKYFDKWVEDQDGNLKFDKVENQFKINGAKYKVGDYFNFIKDSILKLDRNIKLDKTFNIVRALIDYDYFGNVDYKVSRGLIEQLINSKTDEEILSGEKYQDIRIDLSIFKYDISKCKNKYDTDLKEIANLIGNKKSMLERYKSEFNEGLLEEYEKAKEERNKLITRKIELEPEFVRIYKLLEENRIRIEEENKSANMSLIKAQEKHIDLTKTGNEINNKINNQERDKFTLERKMEDCRNSIESLMRQIQEIQNRPNEKVTCPNCNFVLNENTYETIKNDIAEKVDLHAQNIETYKNTILDLEERIKNINNNIKKLENDRDLEAKNYYENIQTIEKLKKRIQENPNVVKIENENENLREELKAFEIDWQEKHNSDIMSLNTQIENLAYNSSLPQKIATLEEEVKKLRIEKTNFENKKDLLQEFKEEKLTLLKQNSQKVFPNLELELIEVNENTGSMKDVCQIKLKDVEYKGINDGHRKLVGFMVIEDIKKALNLEDLPIVFDKRADVDESVFKEILGLTNSQVFCTLVSDEENITLKGE